MRTLCVAEAYPWPAKDGYRLRLANMITALLAAGPVDLLCLDGSSDQRDAPPAGLTVIDAPESPESTASTWMPRWLFDTAPRRLVRRNFPNAREVLAAMASSEPGHQQQHDQLQHDQKRNEQQRYDLVYFSHVDSWSQTWDLVDAPSILDFDNLENLMLRGVRELGPVVGPNPSFIAKAAAQARYAVASGFNLVDEQRWDEAQRRAASCVDRVLVCSELDVVRSGCSNAVVVPNGYELPWEPADHTAVGDPDHPVFLFVGLLSYSANTDAAQWFATDVMPRILADCPGAEFRLVGRGFEAVQHLDALDGVTVVGPVDSLEDELRGADVSVVPIRSGAGTRLKVVEAMANRLPMVSTTVGCEGIDVADGVHLTIVDDASEFANACLVAATDGPARAAMIDAAQDRFQERYQWSTIRAGVTSLAKDIAASGAQR